MPHDASVIGHIFMESTAVEDAILSVQRVDKRKAKMTCILQDADMPNRNNRVYPKKVLDAAIKAPYVVEKLATNSFGGESNHPPPGSSLARQMFVDLNNISHFIHRLYWNPQNPKQLLGDVVTSSNQVGRDFAALILEDDMKCSFSMRGGGDVTAKGGISYVKDPLRIVSYDSVHYPSHKSAYMINLHEAADKTTNITVDMLAEHVAAQSDNHQMILENLDFLKQNEQVKLSLDESMNRIRITSTVTGKDIAYSLLERSLVNEYQDALKTMRGY